MCLPRTRTRRLLQAHRSPQTRRPLQVHRALRALRRRGQACRIRRALTPRARLPIKPARQATTRPPARPPRRRGPLPWPRRMIPRQRCRATPQNHCSTFSRNKARSASLTLKQKAAARCAAAFRFFRSANRNSHGTIMVPVSPESARHRLPGAVIRPRVPPPSKNSINALIFGPMLPRSNVSAAS